MEPNSKQNTIEEELRKHVEKLDKRFERNGWFFMLMLILILFIIVYLFMNVFRTPEVNQYQTADDIMEEFSILEERVHSLELEVESLKSE